MSDMSELEERAERGNRATAAITVAGGVIEERIESRLREFLSAHEGGKCSHDEYVRYAESIATLRRLRNDLIQQQQSGDRAREQMIQGEE